MSDIKVTTTAQIVVNPEQGEAAFQLNRGQQANLGRIDPSLRNMMVGVGWDIVGFETSAPDLDVSVFLLNKNEKTRTDDDFVFYNNLKTPDEGVEHMGDNRTGAGDGDDENISIKLEIVPFEVARIVFTISIYEADLRGQTFKGIRNLFLRIVNDETGLELMRFNLDKELTEMPTATAITVGFLERAGSNWFFEGTGVMTEGGLKEIATKYGILIAH